MRLGIISDIHDNLWNLEPAIEFLSKSADELICCGDLCSPFVMDVLRKFSGPVHVVFGNNDADLFRITTKSDERVKVYGEFASLTLNGARVAVNHFHFLARPLAFSGLYDLVCYGHNHRIRITRLPGIVAVNPGPLMGAAFGPSGWEEVAPTFALHDTSSKATEVYEVLPMVAGGVRTVVPYESLVQSVWAEGT